MLYAPALVTNAVISQVFLLISKITTETPQMTHLHNRITHYTCTCNSILPILAIANHDVKIINFEPFKF